MRLDQIALARECFIHSLEWINPAQVTTVSTKANMAPTQVDMSPAKVDVIPTQVGVASAKVNVIPA